MIDLKYGQIPVEGAPADEPCFVLRAQDVFALGAIRAYMHAAYGNVNAEHMRAIEETVGRFQAWETRKIPDTTSAQLSKVLAG